MCLAAVVLGGYTSLVVALLLGEDESYKWFRIVLGWPEIP